MGVNYLVNRLYLAYNANKRSQANDLSEKQYVYKKERLKQIYQFEVLCYFQLKKDQLFGCLDQSIRQSECLLNV